MDHGSNNFLPLLLIVLLATSVPIVLKKIKYLPIPVVVGEILAGMIIGKSGFNLIAPNSRLEFLSAFGFAFLMFLSGLEVDFSLLSHRNSGKKFIPWYRRSVFLGVAIFLGTLFLSGIFALGLKQLGWISNVPLLTLILSTTSLGIVVPTLKETGLLDTSYGQTILLSALIADFTTMVLITIFVTFYVSGPSYEVLLVLLLFVAFFIFYRMGIRFFHKKIIEDLAHATSEIEVRGTFALILIFIALAQQLGTEIILGAFLAGVIISLIKERTSQLYMKLDAIGYGFFVPIFFIMVGANFDLRTVIQNPRSAYLLPALLVIVYLVKIIPTLILKVNHSWRETLGAGFLLSSRLSLIIAASAIALKLEVITEATNGAIILLALVTCTFSPLLFTPLAPSVYPMEKDTVFIVGIKERLLLLAGHLKNYGLKVIFLTNNKPSYKKLLSSDECVFFGELENQEWLESTGIKNAQSVVVDTNNQNINSEICRICKENFHIDRVVLLGSGTTLPPDRKLYGAQAISPELAIILMAENLVTHPRIFGLLTDNTDDLDILEVKLKNPWYFDTRLSKIKLPGDTLILSIIRNGEKIIPHGNTTLKKGDYLMLVGTTEFVRKAHLILS